MIKRLLSTLILTGFLSTTAFSAPLGLIYTDTIETVALGPATSYSKITQSSNLSVLNLVSVGDSDIEALLKKSGIKEIHRIDKHTFSVFLFYTEETYTIYGN